MLADVEQFVLLNDVFTLVLCTVLKFPQIWKIYKAKSARGISINGIYLEMWTFCVFMSYGYAIGYPFSRYGEYAFLAFQNIIQLVLILKYTKGYGRRTLLFFVFFIPFQFGLATGKFPFWVMTVAAHSATPTSAGSKVAQLVKMYKTKDAGQVSAITWSLGALTSFTRINAVVYSVLDVPILINQFVSLFLNSLVVIASFYYGRRVRTEEEIRADEEEEHED